MKNKILSNVWNSTTTISNDKHLHLNTDSVKELIGKTIAIGPYYYYSLNFCNLPEVIVGHKNQTLNDFFGVTNEDFDLNYLFSRIHPDDINFVQKAEELVFKAIEKVYFNNLLNCKNSYCFRVKDKYDNYKLILHQSVAINVDKNGNLAHSVNIHTNIEHLTTVNPRTVSIFGFNGLPSFLSLDPFEENLFDIKENIYSDREIEILRILASGFSSKEVALKLHISEHTVKTHKRNILKKSNCKNITEVVVKCIEQGTI